MKKDIRDLQNQVLQAQEAQQRAEEENRALKEQINRRTAPNGNGAEGDATNHPKLSSSEIKAWKKRAKLAGSRVTALYEPFLDLEPLAGHQVQTHIDEILDDVKRAQESDPELDEEYNPTVYWKTDHFGTPGSLVIVRDMVYHMAKSPGHTWLEDWFQHEIHEGARKHRSAIVHQVQSLCNKIFDITNHDFEDRSQRPNLPQVVALRNFLHLEERNDDGTPDLNQFFRDIIIVRVCSNVSILECHCNIYTGSSADAPWKISHQNWQTVIEGTQVLFQDVAHYAHHTITACLHRNNRDAYFEEGSGSIDYSAWFHARLRLLEAVYERHHDAYVDLIRYYNKEVLGINQQGVEADHHGGVQGVPDENMGMDVDDLDFLEQLGAE
ncbi:hypothetical protein RSAG8_11787, partial [Rhizoctonia solani AG-8 WAC10335]